MIKVGIIGSDTYENKIKIKDVIFKLKEQYGDDVEIATRGNTVGAEKYVRKYALYFGLKYKEFNPAHTTSTLYSALSESFYNKPYTPFNFVLRDKIFSKYVDVCFCLATDTKSVSVSRCLSELKKANKKYSILS